MKFYYQGNKNKSNTPGFASGCLILIGFGAIIYMITLLDSIGDLKEYWWQILLAFVMGVSLFATMFAKKAKLFNYHVSIKDGYFKIEKISIPIEKLILDYYSNNNTFIRYHLRD